MENPERLRKSLLVASAIVILGGVFMLFVDRLPRKSPPAHIPPFQTDRVDRAVAWAAAVEAHRIKDADAQIVLLLYAHESGNKTGLEHQSKIYADGFTAGMRDAAGNPVPGMNLLGKKYSTDDPARKVAGAPWPLLSLLQQVARDFQRCNLIVSFCGPPTLTSEDAASVDSQSLPHLIAINNTTLSPDQLGNLFATGLVETIFNLRTLTPAILQMEVPPNQLVEATYQIFRRDER
jgi:hypothetical protein